MICMICNKPIVMYMEARYAIADSPDGECGEHWDCRKVEDNKLKADLDELSEASPELKDTLNRLKKLFVVGWLLCGFYSGNIAWYPDKKTCEKAAEYHSSNVVTCVPDRFEFEEGGSLYQKAD